MLLPRSSYLFMLSLCKTRRTTVTWPARAETDKDPGEGRKEGGEGAKRRFSSSPIPIVVNKPNQSGSSGDNGIECGNKKKKKFKLHYKVVRLNISTRLEGNSRYGQLIIDADFAFKKRYGKIGKPARYWVYPYIGERQMRIRNFKTPNERLKSTLSRNRRIFAHRSFRV